MTLTRRLPTSTSWLRPSSSSRARDAERLRHARPHHAHRVYHRIYTVAEKMQMGDGRFDSEVVLKAAKTLAKRAVLFDMQAQAEGAGTVISAVMFGALAGSGALRSRAASARRRSARAARARRLA